MNRYARLIVVLGLGLVHAPQTQVQPVVDRAAETQTRTPTINITKLAINDTKLELSYEIENNSDSEVWVCDDMGFDWPCNSEICLVEDNQLLTIRRRLDVAAPGIVWARRPLAKYVRLRPGKKRHESLSVNIPLDEHRVLGGRRPAPKNLAYVSRLAIEIGYYVGNLPDMIFEMLEEAEKTYDSNIGRRPQILEIFGGALTFNYFREQLRNRDEEIWIPYTYQKFKGEKILRATIGGLRIPCKERQGRPKEDQRQTYYWPEFGPDSKTCTRIEIRYEPSSLEYFFAFAIDQSLLSREEIGFLQSAQTFVIEDHEILNSFVENIIGGVPFNGIVHEKNAAHFDCYHDNDHITSFTAYGSTIVETEHKKRLCYQKDFLNIWMLTPEIEKLEYRVRCAANLRNLYHRLRLYNLIVAKQKKQSPPKDKVVYPAASEWFDALISSGPFPTSVIRIFLTSKKLREPHVCPSVGEGKSTYAINPNCRPDSPPDMVLLFETKAGWNQHGGPESFAFYNHNPKGGCVLLNDGTVKFIRTKDELQQLRWK